MQPSERRKSQTGMEKRPLCPDSTPRRHHAMLALVETLRNAEKYAPLLYQE